MESKIINGSESFRDASFSYLRSDHRASTASSARPSFAADRKPKPSAGGGDSEISVFAAERYFNTPRPDPTRPAVRAPTLPPRHADVAVDLRRQPRRRRLCIVEGSRSFFAALGCTGGACSDDKSVSVSVSAADRRHVDDDHHKRQDRHDQNDRRLRYEARSTKRPEDHFAFPVLSSAAAAESRPPAAAEDAGGEPPRMSLEVFGSSKESGGAAVDDVAANLERKLSVLTWDAIPAAGAGGKPYGGSRVSPKTRAEDLDSEASSDLFEIENIITSAASPRPSEASIEWSVVTASADVAGGEYDEKKISASRSTAAGKRRPAGLLGCKAARVAENALTTTTSASSPKGD